MVNYKECTKNTDYLNFYGEFYDSMLEAEKIALNIIKEVSYSKNDESGVVEYCISRIKSPKSMIAKLEKGNYPVNAKSSIENITDSVGLRIICKFLNDVYYVVDALKNRFDILKEKDYIKMPKQNGYRSYHIIFNVNTSSGKKIPVEIQIRTISQDSWASLEHKMKYKKNIKNQKLIQNELKRCADEMASTDISMQTIYELIENL